MKVKLVSYTTPCIEELGEDSNVLDLIAYCARVSNPSNQLNTETSDKLINYLVKWKHWSPFEMANVCLEIETTRDIARQILRHRSFTFQEFSQRYADPVKDLSFEVREARLQDQKNRQNSIETDDRELQTEWVRIQQDVIRQSKFAYSWAINNGIAKEVARAVLPEGLTMSRMYVNGTIRSWIHYIDIRSDKATQKEHREIAVACAEAISKLFPLVNNFKHE
jgi:thymidylate synthase (FAD)